MRTTCSHGNYIACTLCLMKTLPDCNQLIKETIQNTITCKNKLFNVKTYRRLHFLLRNPRAFFVLLCFWGYTEYPELTDKKERYREHK